MKIETIEEVIKIPYGKILPGEFFVKDGQIFKKVEVYFGAESKRVSVSINDQISGTYTLGDNDLVFPISTLRVTISK